MVEKKSRISIGDLSNAHRVDERELERIMGGVEPTTFPTNMTLDVSKSFSTFQSPLKLDGTSFLKFTR